MGWCWVWPGTGKGGAWCRPWRGSIISLGVTGLQERMREHRCEGAQAWCSSDNGFEGASGGMSRSRYGLGGMVEGYDYDVVDGKRDKEIERDMGLQLWLGFHRRGGSIGN